MTLFCLCRSLQVRYFLFRPLWPKCRSRMPTSSRLPVSRSSISYFLPIFRDLQQVNKMQHTLFCFATTCRLMYLLLFYVLKPFFSYSFKQFEWHWKDEFSQIWPCYIQPYVFVSILFYINLSRFITSLLLTAPLFFFRIRIFQTRPFTHPPRNPLALTVSRH